MCHIVGKCLVSHSAFTTVGIKTNNIFNWTPNDCQVNSLTVNIRKVLDGLTIVIGIPIRVLPIVKYVAGLFKFVRIQRLFDIISNFLVSHGAGTAIAIKMNNILIWRPFSINVNGYTAIIDGISHCFCQCPAGITGCLTNFPGAISAANQPILRESISGPCQI